MCFFNNNIKTLAYIAYKQNMVLLYNNCFLLNSTSIVAQSKFMNSQIALQTCNNIYRNVTLSQLCDSTQIQYNLSSLITDWYIVLYKYYT